MTCAHLNQLYQLCKDSQVRLSSTDLIHIVCKQCEKEEVCPSVLFEEYDQDEQDEVDKESTSLPKPADKS
jgi:hypothetical protein